MKRFPLLTFLVLLISFSNGAMAQNKNEAIKIYQEYSCDGCHSIKDQGVPLVERDVGEKSDDGREPPDLSKVGGTRDAEWIGRFLQKKEEIKGKTHKRMFKGSKDERTTLSTWLASLK